MVLKGSQRGGGQNLAAHLMRTDDNEHVLVHELRGFASDTIKGAFKEAEAISRGAVLVAAFIAFLDFVLGYRIDWSYAGWYTVIGYVAGTVGVEILIAESQQSTASNVEILPPELPQHQYQHQPRSLPRREAEPFRYASWDDEEAGR